MPRSKCPSLPLALALLPACADTVETAETADTTAASTGTAGPEGVTYHRDVRPVLERHCLACHRDGGIAPFALDSAAAAAPFAGQIVDSTVAREMPPFPVDNTGECHSFRDARWLTDEELATLAAWADQGAPEGDPADAPAEQPAPAGLDGEVRTIEMAAPYTPNAGLDDDYRCFLVDGAAAPEGDTFVTGFDVHPGNPRIVHHVIVYTPRNADAVDQARALDAADPGEGYTCFGTAQVAAGVAVAWAPGGVPTRYPEGLGVRLEAGAPVIVQMHYNTLAGPGMSDRTAIDLRVVAGGVTPARFSGVGDIDLALPPGEPVVETAATLPLPGMSAGHPIRVHGVFPHMHTLGRSLDIELAGDEAACLIRVPRYEFHWQLLYFYDQPVDLAADQPLTITCRYDTRTRTEVTGWGEGTMDEMCLAGLLVTDL